MIEGAIYTLFPSGMQRMMAQALTLLPSALPSPRQHPLLQAKMGNKMAKQIPNAPADVQAEILALRR